MQVCFGCLHTFEDQNLEEIRLTSDITVSFQAIRSSLSKIQVNTSANRQAIAHIESDLKLLLKKVMQEMQSRDERLESLTAQVKYLSEQEDALRKANAELLNQSKAPRQPPKQSKAKATPPFASGLLHRFLIASNLATTPSYGPLSGGVYNTAGLPATPDALGNSPSASMGQTLTPYTPARTPRIENRFGETVSHSQTKLLDRGSSASSPRTQHVHQPLRPADSVGATLYNILETMTSQVRAAVGILWLVGVDRDEILAPFVYGRKVNSVVRNGGTPYHVNVASSIVGSVVSTGITVNLSNQTGTFDPTVTQLMTASVSTSLYVPIFKEFGRSKQQCYGVFQAIAANGVGPFDEKDEAAAVAGSAILSYVLTAFQVLIPEWTTRVFDPSGLRKISYYSEEEADRDAQQKGKTLVDTFQLPSSLVYRCDLVDPTTKITKQVVQQAHHSLVTIVDALKETHRYSVTLETSWRGAITAQASLEKKVEELSRQLDLARQGLNDARRTLNSERAAQYVKSKHAGPATATDGSSVARKGDTAVLDWNREDTADLDDSVSTDAGTPKPTAGANTINSTPSRKKKTLSKAELEEIEARTQAQMKAFREGTAFPPLPTIPTPGSKDRTEKDASFFVTQPSPAGSSPQKAGSREAPSGHHVQWSESK
jgi:hypothetical protein